MKVGIDFHAAEQEGTGNCSYIRNLVEALIGLGSSDEFFLYITDPALAYFQRFQGLPRVHLRGLAGSNAVRRLVSLGRQASADRLDVLHVQYVAPPFYKGKLIVSVHDLAFVRNPRWFPLAKRFYLRTLVPRSLRRSSQVITLSQFSRQEIVRVYPFCAERTHVTPLAAGPRFRPGQGSPEEAAALGALGINKEYLLYVGRLNVRKNIPALLAAFACLKRTQGIPHQLVLAGPGDFWPGRGRNGRRKGDGLGPQAVWAGLVPEDLLPTLYSRASVFIFPSLYEGFGLPILEAMACGCPVVASRAASIPEIAGEAAVLVFPPEPGRLAEAVHRILADPKLREHLRLKGLERSGRFQWSDTAQKTSAIYRRTLADSPGAD